MSDVHADDLIRVAEDDIASARILLATKPPILATAAYHAQQGAEKAVKAALTKLGLTYPRTHKIDVLLEVMPDGHPFTTRATRLAVTAPWAIEFRYATATPPSAGEVERALTDALDLTSEVAKALSPPSTELTIGLAATTADKWRSQRIVALWIDRELAERAVAPPTDADLPATRAFRAIAETSVHQPEYDLSDPRVGPTGRTLQGWPGVHHVQDLIASGGKTQAKARLYLNAVRLDDAVRASPELHSGFAALLANHLGKEPSQNPPPIPQRPRGRGGR